ncbi:MAG: hypothetical protein HSCHL_2307 [Hydrogenibacillus schlegelii]|uniref:Uncharacterized protein n=1 Tax=Hydrogenibacillus schlegelii TaxID=1484 RepID=A0A2T5GEV2_HYDSH|nr:MAG: hypothetical protein HSCHL_2307 [Hydrogenibacillus schlegelii]
MKSGLENRARLIVSWSRKDAGPKKAGIFDCSAGAGHKPAGRHIHLK